jgi:iron complex outermembrane receptor protein
VKHCRSIASCACALALLIGMLVVIPTRAADTAAKTYHFDIPGEALSQALRTFGQTAGEQIIFTEDLVYGLPFSGLHGDFSAEVALQRLLQGTGLVSERTPAGVIMIRRAARSTDADDRKTTPIPAQSPPDAVRVAQATPGQASGDVSVDNKEDTSKQQGTLQEVHPNIPEILIQGSKVMNVDVKRTEDDIQPYYILDSEQIEQSGASNVEDFLKQRLTMNSTFATQTQLYNNNVGVTSSINLRGLGSNETLVLIDGRRSAGVGLFGGEAQPDINGIPLAAIERIEVLPGSASAIYGGAALGGVVNIILKKNFDGGEFGYTYENTFNASSPRRTVNALYGLSLEDGKTRIMLSGSYSDAEPLLLGDRLDLVQRGISTILKNSPSFLYNTANPFPGATPNIAGVDANGNPTNLVLKNGTPLNSPITFIPAGTAPGANLSAGLLANAGTYNLNLAPGTGEYGLQNQFGSTPRDKAFMATVRREFTESLEAFTEFSTVSNSSRQLFNAFGNYTVPSSAPDNPFQQAVMINIPNALSVPTTSDSVTQSVTVGLIARLPADWRSELDYTWSRNSADDIQITPDTTAFNEALAAGTVNPFVDTLAYPLNLTSYIGTSSESARSTLNDLGIRASGPVGSLPWGRPSLTIGLEHREEGFDDYHSSTVYPFDPASDVQLVYFGQSQSTSSIYAEAAVPLVTATNAVPGISSLDLQLAGRSEHYTVFASPLYDFAPPYQALDYPNIHSTIQYTSTNPTVGLKYAPVKGVTLRASYATAFLPPTAVQLLPDPVLVCGPTPCALITDPRNGETYNVNFSTGGNPSLKPQTSKDWDFGLIWEPKEGILQGLRFDLEYYKITQPNYITTPSLQQIVSDPAFAGLVTRDPITGRITVINDTYVNATQYKTNGWDLKFDYRKPTAYGIFDLYALGTVIEHDERQFGIGSALLEYVGYPGGDNGEARVKANATLSWEYRHWTLAWATTYVSSYQQFGSPGGPYAIQNGPYTYYTAAQGGYTIPSQVYHQVFGRYSVDGQSGSAGFARKVLSHVTVEFGIKNLFNKLPPFDAFYPPYFYSSYGDPRLRDYWLTVRKAF